MVIVVLAGTYAGLAAVLLTSLWFVVPPASHGWAEFAKVAALGLTLITSLLAAAMPAAIALPKAAEIRQSKLAMEAYRDLYAAANSYFRALSPLQTSEWDVARIREAESRMSAAEGLALHIKLDDETAWLDFWQQARFIAESANEDEAGRSKLWAREVGALEESWNDFKVRARKAVGR